MRFLPGIGGPGGPEGEDEKLKQISNQLTNVLSKRVACLTILLVIVMPLFTLGAYPEGDFSKEVWTESLWRRVQRIRDLQASNGCTTGCVQAVDEFWQAVDRFASFYAGREYGPYSICVAGDPAQQGGLVGCRDLSDRSHFAEPERRSFRMHIATNDLAATFDYSAPTRSEADMSLVLISLVIVLMCGACMLLNYSASELAVRPLERMMTSIKKSAKAIFSTVSAMAPSEDAEDFGEDMDGEVALLERVVRKIATLAEISSKKNPFDAATMTGMKTEELGVLALTALSNASRAEIQAPLVDAGSGMDLTEKQQNRTEISVTMQWQLEEIGLVYEVLNSWDFNVLDLNDKKQEQVVAWLMMNNPGSCHYTENNVDISKLRAFVAILRGGYIANPYHNFAHAVDVTHTVFRYMVLLQAESVLSMLDQFSLLVAAASHDIGHIGLNNSFLTEVQHELAIRYNDRSPLENMHCCKLFEILSQQPVNVFSNVPADQYRDVRKTIIDVILHTDITQHPGMVQELELLYEMNSKVFEASSNDMLGEAEVEVLSTTENKKLILKALLHGADISNPTKPWNISQDWATMVLDEYANQGDQEKSRGIPVQALNDRDKVNRPTSQIGFIEFIVGPWVVAKVKVFPALSQINLMLCENLSFWQRMWVEESNPNDAEREKVKERITKITNLLRSSNRWTQQAMPGLVEPKSARRRRSFSLG